MKSINKYKLHPSILQIYSKLSRPESFSFNTVSYSDMEKEIRK